MWSPALDRRVAARMAGHGTSANGWAKSSASETSDCVEVRFVAEHVHVRDSKDRHGAFLTFTCAEWRAFVSGVRLGEFDLPVSD